MSESLMMQAFMGQPYIYHEYVEEDQKEGETEDMPFWYQFFSMGEDEE